MARTVEVFTAGCPACDSLVQLVQTIACPSCDISILSMHDKQVSERALALGIRTIPAVVINGELAPCCTGGGYNEATLRSMGIGQS